MCGARAGFDVPDMLAAGPRDVLVPASGARGGARGRCSRPSCTTAAAPPRGRRPGGCSPACSARVASSALIVWIGVELLS